MSLNRVILIGRLTRDPEVQTTQSGISVARFTIAVDRPRTDSQTGEKIADFFRVKAWRQSADYVANYLAKGRLVAVEGRVQNNNWTASDGTKRYDTEIEADRVQGLDRPRDTDAGAQRGPGEEPEARLGADDESDPGPDPFVDE